MRLSLRPVIRAVLFDLFETLVTESRASIRRAASLASQLGVADGSYRRQWKLRRRDVVLGRATFRDTIAEITTALGGTPDQQVLDDLRSERLSQKAAVLRDVQTDILTAVEGLRAEGLRLALVTNSFAEDVAGWESSPLYPYFAVTLFSCVVGLAKPDPRMYGLACRDLDVLPAEALFIGDGADEELAGARQAGLHTCQALWFVVGRGTGAPVPEQHQLRHPSDVVRAAQTLRGGTRPWCT